MHSFSILDKNIYQSFMIRLIFHKFIFLIFCLHMNPIYFLSVRTQFRRFQLRGRSQMFKRRGGQVVQKCQLFANVYKVENNNLAKTLSTQFVNFNGSVFRTVILWNEYKRLNNLVFISSFFLHFSASLGGVNFELQKGSQM